MSSPPRPLPLPLPLCLLASLLPLLASAQSPTCALSGKPCHPPTWEASWNLTQSTVIQPSSASWFVPEHPWGLISLDWSVNRATWFANRSIFNTTCEATSIENCRRLKAAGLAHRCFIYHNMELALLWLESQRAVMLDPTKASFFLQYGWNSTTHSGNGTIYNEARAEGWQFFWNYLNEEAANYFVSSVDAVLNDDAVDGTFTDDVDGLPAEHPSAQARIGMTDAELAALRFATQTTSQLLIDTLVAHNKYNWQAFGSRDTSALPPSLPGPASRRGAALGAGPSPSTCAAWMRTNCAAAMQAAPMLMKMDSSPGNANQTVAAFLIVRPPYGYLGWSWESGDEKWDDIFYLQAGEPQGLCTEAPAGVFSRAWSEGTAQLDCNKWAAELPFPSL